MVYVSYNAILSFEYNTYKNKRLSKLTKITHHPLSRNAVTFLPPSSFVHSFIISKKGALVTTTPVHREKDQSQIPFIDLSRLNAYF